MGPCSGKNDLITMDNGGQLVGFMIHFGDDDGEAYNMIVLQTDTQIAVGSCKNGFDEVLLTTQSHLNAREVQMIR